MLLRLALMIVLAPHPIEAQPPTVCYPIERFGYLCVDLPREAWVQHVHGEYAWINDHNYKAADGTHCCGIADCREIELKDVSHQNGMMMTPFGAVSPRGTYQSRDGKTWVCRRHFPSGTALNSCLFIPGGG